MRYKKTLMVLFVFVFCLTGCGEEPIVTTVGTDETNSVMENETVTESEQDRVIPEYDTSIPVSFVDYDALMEEMDVREREAFLEYLPVLTGEERFIVTYKGPQGEETGEFTMYEWFDTIHSIKECDLSFSNAACLDLDNDGILEVIIPFWFYWDEYLILHKEGDLFYGISIGTRGFECLQQNGYFLSSGGATCTHAERLAFCGNRFVITEAAHNCEYSKPTYEIDGQAVDGAAWELWYSKHFNGDAVWYEVQPDFSLLTKAEEKLKEKGLEVPKDCYIRRVTTIPSKDFYIERIWIDYLVQPEDAYKHCEDYYFLYDKETGDFLWYLYDKVSDYEPYEACNFFAHMEDVNFDGREDIVIHNGYTRYNAAYRAWIQTEDGLFVYCPDFLEKMGDYELDFEEQAVIGQWSNGNPGGRTVSWYHFEENKYKLYYREYETLYNQTPVSYDITLGVSYDGEDAVAAYIYRYPRYRGYPGNWDEENGIYAVIKPEDSSDYLYVTFYGNEEHTNELYTLRLLMTNPENMLEEIEFDDYNSDGYLDIKIPCSVSTSGIIYSLLLKNPDTGLFEAEIPNS